MDGAAPWSLHEILRVTNCDIGALDSAASLTPFGPLQPRLPSQRTMAASAQHAAAPPAPALAEDRRPLRAGRCQVPDCTTPDEGSRAYNQRCR
jgi:hypothetical protein